MASIIGYLSEHLVPQGIPPQVGALLPVVIALTVVNFLLIPFINSSRRRNDGSTLVDTLAFTIPSMLGLGWLMQVTGKVPEPYMVSP